MDYTWTVPTPTITSSLMSAAAVTHRFSCCCLCCCFLSLLVWISSFSLVPRKKKGLMFTLLSFLALVLFIFCSLVSLLTSRQKDGLMVVSSLTLHSGQSYPGTPEQPGSRTGTHPQSAPWLVSVCAAF